MKFYTLIAMVALVNGHKLIQKQSNNIVHKHAVDYIDEKGDEIDTSLAVQLESKMNLGESEEPDLSRVQFFAQKLGIEW